MKYWLKLIGIEFLKGIGQFIVDVCDIVFKTLVVCITIHFVLVHYASTFVVK